MIARKNWVLFGTALAAMLVAIDITIVNTTLPEIKHDLHASLSELQWIIAGFGLVFSSLLVVMGRIADLIGRRKILYLGIIGFVLSSLGAGLSTSGIFLITMRILQGFFGAALFPAGMAITASAFPKPEQGRILSIYGSVLGIGLAFGPLIGSAVIDFLSWRWIFFINIPVALISLIVCFLSIRETEPITNTKVDWLGAVLITIFLASLIFAITEGGYYGWTSPLIISIAIISILSLIGFLIKEKKSKMPLIPIGLFLNSGFLLGLIVYMVAVALAWSILFLAPLYLHTILGFPTKIVGLILFPMTIMTVFAPMVAGYFYDKKSKLLVIQIVFFLSAFSLFLFTLFSFNTSLALVLAAFILFGTAWGMGNGIATPLSLSKLPSSENAGLVVGALTTTMNTFAVFILTIDTTLFKHFAQPGSLTGFMRGFNAACYLLLFISIFFWICSVVILRKVKL